MSSWFPIPPTPIFFMVPPTLRVTLVNGQYIGKYKPIFVFYWFICGLAQWLVSTFRRNPILLLCFAGSSRTGLLAASLAAPLGQDPQVWCGHREPCGRWAAGTWGKKLCLERKGEGQRERLPGDAAEVMPGQRDTRNMTVMDTSRQENVCSENSKIFFFF